jgi:hypothetical protein
MINASTERILTTLKACDGNEFNPLVTSSKVEGYGV